MIIADTGFFIALGNRNDQDHHLAMKVLRSLNEPLITTYPVVTETCYLLSARAGHASQCIFLRELANAAFDVFELQRQHIEQMVSLMERYADLPMDMADASLVVLAESLKDGRILTTDRRDFSVYRWHNSKTFDNLLG
jgi:uncharacterized protein